MSFEQNDTINLGNYEEFFILYMDNELTVEQTAAVDAFVLQHPHLAEELDLLMSTKLSPERISFDSKEELFSPAMKGNTVDEALLLYIDNELPAAEKSIVAQRIEAEKDYALQHSLLMQTKLDDGEKILHPNKKELYRRTERVVPFGFWMRYAAAVVVLLVGTLFFVLDLGKPSNTVSTETAEINPAKSNSTVTKKLNATERIVQAPVVAKQEAALTKNEGKQSLKKLSDPAKPNKTESGQSTNSSLVENTAVARRSNEAVQLNERLITQPSLKAVALNETITRTSVTSKIDSSYNKQNGPSNNPEVDWAVENTKKAPARGFFRKVSRFIERKTGIGTVNDDNELLIGAVALKLK